MKVVKLTEAESAELLRLAKEAEDATEFAESASEKEKAAEARFEAQRRNLADIYGLEPNRAALSDDCQFLVSR